MERFRIVVAGLMWSDLSPQLAEVKDLSEDCGMSFGNLVAETFEIADEIVAFRGCSELWDAVDRVSQLDVLLAHVHNRSHVGFTFERGFAPDMLAMSLWGSSTLDQPPLLNIDRKIAGAVSLLPLLALAVAVTRRRGRRLALIATAGTVIALVAAFVDPTGQDRHTIVFRIVAGAIALMALLEATTRPSQRPVDEASPEALSSDVAIPSELDVEPGVVSAVG